MPRRRVSQASHACHPSRAARSEIPRSRRVSGAPSCGAQSMRDGPSTPPRAALEGRGRCDNRCSWRPEFARETWGMYGLTHAKHKPSSGWLATADASFLPLAICFLRAFFGASPFRDGCVDEAAPAGPSCLPRNGQRPIVFKYDGVHILDPIHALRANGAPHLFLCYAFLLECAGDEFPV